MNKEIIITRTTLPPSSILAKSNYQYVDSYKGAWQPTNPSLQITDIGKAFFSSSPKWVDKLFDWRNRIVAFFGLKTTEGMQDRQLLLTNFTCNPGERMGLFRVYQLTEQEVILGEDDKHLNFRVSLFLNKNTNTGISHIYNRDLQ